MPEVTIIGTIGIDDVKTPFGERKGVMGGSATYASYAASFFSKPGLIAIAGTDLPSKYFAMMEKKGIDLKGVEIKGKNFRWSGVYEYKMDTAKTLKTELNSLSDFSAELPDDYKKCQYIFLGNIHPRLQIKALKQTKPRLSILDTMNYWIDNTKDELLNAIKMIDVLLLNDGEARQLFNTVNLVSAAKQALKLGPKYIIIKKGEHGALLFSKNSLFNAPGYPLEIIKDPTGCGDCFAGGLIGYLAKNKDITEPSIRKAIIYGSVIASFNAEDFSLFRLQNLSMKDIEHRYSEFEKMRMF